MIFNYKSNFISIDDFYSEPDHVRAMAVAANYNHKGEDVDTGFIAQGAWPGLTSIDIYKVPKIDTIVSKLLNKPARQVSNSGKFRVSVDGDVGRSPVHVDSTTDTIIAGVLYLSKTTWSIPGTIFYTHKETNKNTFETNLHSVNDFTNLDKWNVDMVSYVKYNRLILYPANRFHGPGPSFGSDINDARLVQLFLWEII